MAKKILDDIRTYLAEASASAMERGISITQKRSNVLDSLEKAHECLLQLGASLSLVEDVKILFDTIANPSHSAVDPRHFSQKILDLKTKVPQSLKAKKAYA